MRNSTPKTALILRAREVLEDCKVAASKLCDGVSGREWRIRWVTAVALLRAVGHVLSKVDATSDTILKEVAHDAWTQLQKTKPNPVIFWQFIEDERNNILKQYRFSAGQGVTVRPGTLHLNPNTGEQHAEAVLPTPYNYEMNSGPYAGKDQRVVLREAINWWEEYLSNIEVDYTAKRP